jgi:ribokinase
VTGGKVVAGFVARVARVVSLGANERVTLLAVVAPDVPRVVSAGSVNVDHVAYCDTETIRSLAGTDDWFPAPGETVRVGSIPERVERYVSETHIGGKGANQSVAAALACPAGERGGGGSPAESVFLGKVGTDDSEWRVRETLAEYGVDVSGVGVADCPTGSAHVFVDETGENCIAVRAGANGQVGADYVRNHAETILSADCLLLQNELPVATGEAVLDLVADADCAGTAARDTDTADTTATTDTAARDTDTDSTPTVLLDPAPADGAERLVAHPAVDLLTPNESEFAWLSGESDAPGAPASDLLADFGGVIVRTRGAEDVLVEDRRVGVGVGTGGEAFAVTPPPVEPVDTTGAGDVFAGYLAVELACGRSLRSACRTAVAASACSTEREGVQTATPTRAEVVRFAERVGFDFGG